MRLDIRAAYMVGIQYRSGVRDALADHHACNCPCYGVSVSKPA